MRQKQNSNEMENSFNLPVCSRFFGSDVLFYASAPPTCCVLLLQVYKFKGQKWTNVCFPVIPSNDHHLPEGSEEGPLLLGDAPADLGVPGAGTGGRRTGVLGFLRLPDE